MKYQGKQQLKHEREQHSWSQEKLAEMLSTTPHTVSRWERGLSLPYPYFREKLCTLFGKDIRALGFVDEPEEEVTSSETVSDTSIVVAKERRLDDPLLPFTAVTTVGLVGRMQLLAKLKQSVRAKVPMLALNGLPGVGKTALAVALALDPEIQTHFPDGILWAGLGPTPNILGTLSRWGTLLDVELREYEKERTDETWVLALRAAIGTRRMLLVIDDVWETATAMLLQVGGPHCIHLITTRFPQIAFACAGQEALTIPELDEADGITLLACFVPDLVASEAETASRLVRMVGGLPLALTLIGKYLGSEAYSRQPRRFYGAVERLWEKNQHLRLTVSPPSVGYPTHSSSFSTLSLQSVIAVSDASLATQAQTALRALSVFPAKPNSFTEEAALAVMETSVEVLDDLCDASLVEGSGRGRYTLHQTIADYARSDSNERVAMERMVTYFVQYTETNRTDYKAMDAESKNILTVLEATYTLDRREDMGRIVCAFSDFLLARGLYRVAEKHLQQAKMLTQTQQDMQISARILFYLGNTVEKLGEYEHAEAYLQEGLMKARQVKDVRLQGFILNMLGKVVHQRGQTALGETYLQEGFVLAQQVYDVELLSSLLMNLGAVSNLRGDNVQAERYYLEGLSKAKQTGQHEQVCRLLNGLALVGEQQGNYIQAESYYQEALAIARQEQFRDILSLLLSNIGVLAYKRGNLEQTTAYLHEGLVLARHIGHRGRISALLTQLGELAVEQGDGAKAEAYLQEGMLVARQIGQPKQIIFLLLNLGKLATQQGEYFQAEIYLEDALKQAWQNDMHWLAGLILCSWGDLDMIQQRIDRAEVNFHQALEYVSEKSADAYALIHYGLARVAAQHGRMLEARQFAERSLTILETIGHQQAAEVRRWIEASFPELPHQSADI